MAFLLLACSAGAQGIGAHNAGPRRGSGVSAAVGGEWKMKITFGAYNNRTETLTNFPVLVVFSNEMTSSGAAFNFADQAFAKTNGYDLRFWSGDEVSELPYEIERWTNAASPSAFVWVRVPSIATNTDFIWAKWGDTNKGQQAYTTNGAVWSNGFALLDHMSRTDGSTETAVYDSSTNHYAGTVQESCVWTNIGIADGCLRLTTNSTYKNGIYMNGVAIGANWTLSAWFMGLVSNNRSRILFTGNTTDPDDEIELLAGTNGVSCYTPTVHQQSGVMVSPASSSNQWLQLTAVGTGGVTKIYLNGVYGGTCGVKSTQPIRSIGYWNQNDGYNWNCQFAEYLDEVRIETVERSSNWVWASWLNVASNQVFNKYDSLGH